MWDPRAEGDDGDFDVALEGGRVRGLSARAREKQASKRQGQIGRILGWLSWDLLTSEATG
jgi:hypothetical protein